MFPITDPFALLVFLTVVVGLIFYISEIPAFQKFFDALPALVFCYFVPMLTTTFGITAQASPLYDAMNKYLLPPILLLLLISADMRAILRLGPKAIVAMLAGSLGIMIGAFVSYGIFRSKLDPNAWQNFGALAATWTGGSANMAAVKVALDIDNDLFAAIQPVDPIIAYSWMGILLWLASKQTQFSRRFKCNDQVLEDLKSNVALFSGPQAKPITTTAFITIVAIALLCSYLSIAGGTQLAGHWKASGFFDRHPGFKILSGGTLTIMFVTLIGTALSFTPLRNLEQFGASKIGYGLLYILLPSFGAQANLSKVAEVPWYVVSGVIMIGFHVVATLAALIIMRAPLFFGATGSQANFGGAGSASIVAAAYQPALAPVGVLLGIFGGVFGTYAGLLTAQLCRAIAPLP